LVLEPTTERTVSTADDLETYGRLHVYDDGR